MIANLYQLDKEDILQFNDMTSEMSISEGQTIFLAQRKKKSNKTDNIYYKKKIICGALHKKVQLHRLLSRNKLSTGEERNGKRNYCFKRKNKRETRITHRKDCSKKS
ncbi:MAG: hypothetical protein R2807_03385 [Chitinophagales bacterium]